MLSSFKYCVIVPHRNVPELLAKCLDSIPKLKEICVLVVDNSDEGKNAEMVTKGQQFGFGGLTVIEREPRGVGYIRNEALRYLRNQHYQGKLVFADADDYFTPEATECFEMYKDTEYDLVWFGVEGRDELGNNAANADYIKISM